MELPISKHLAISKLVSNLVRQGAKVVVINQQRTKNVIPYEETAYYKIGPTFPPENTIRTRITTKAADEPDPHTPTG